MLSDARRPSPIVRHWSTDIIVRRLPSLVVRRPLSLVMHHLPSLVVRRWSHRWLCIVIVSHWLSSGLFQVPGHLKERP